MHIHTILVIEDDLDIRELVADIVESTTPNYRVVTAATGQEGLDYLRSNPQPCVIFVDLHLPGMSGQEVIAQKASEQNLRDVPVVVMTGQP